MNLAVCSSFSERRMNVRRVKGLWFVCMRSIFSAGLSTSVLVISNVNSENISTTNDSFMALGITFGGH